MSSSECDSIQLIFHNLSVTFHRICTVSLAVTLDPCPAPNHLANDSFSTRRVAIDEKSFCSEFIQSNQFYFCRFVFTFKSFIIPFNVPSDLLNILCCTNGVFLHSIIAHEPESRQNYSTKPYTVFESVAS